MIWPSHAHVNVQHQTNQSDSIAFGPHLFILLVGVCLHWTRLLVVQCEAWGMREACYGCKHLVLPCSTFTHGRTWLGSIGLTNESGHSVRSMSTTLFWAKQGTSTLVPVGYVYVDDVKGYRSCTSIFVGQESDTIVFEPKGSCENIHARPALAPFCTSPPCTSHSKKRKGFFSPDAPHGKEVSQTRFAPMSSDMQRRKQAIKQNDMESVGLSILTQRVHHSKHLCIEGFLLTRILIDLRNTGVPNGLSLFTLASAAKRSHRNKKNDKKWPFVVNAQEVQ